jgi:hypothetical protein
MSDSRSPGMRGRLGDSKGDAGTHEGAMKNTSSWSSEVASRSHGCHLKDVQGVDDQDIVVEALLEVISVHLEDFQPCPLGVKLGEGLPNETEVQHLDEIIRLLVVHAQGMHLLQEVLPGLFQGHVH